MFGSSTEKKVLARTVVARVLAPDVSRQETIIDLAKFHQDLGIFSDRMRTYERVVSEEKQEYGARVPEVPHDIEDLRQSLLERAGWIQPLFERVLGGKLAQPQSWRMGPDLNVWDLALHQNYGYSQAHYAGVLADHLRQVIGKVKANPVLLDAPRNTGEALPSPPRPSQIINVHGGNVNIAQTNGNVAQSTNAGNAEHLRLQLATLEQAIANLNAPEEDRDGWAEPIKNTRTEIERSKPTLARLATGLATIQTIANTSQQLYTGWEQVRQIAIDVAPKLNELVQFVAANHILPS